MKPALQCLANPTISQEKNKLTIKKKQKTQEAHCVIILKNPIPAKNLIHDSHSN